MADSLGVLLLTWNQAFYRYGVFDFDKLELCIKNNLDKLNIFRKMHINQFSEKNELEIKKLFNEFLESLKIKGGKLKGKTNPVATAKALHILAPNLFPLWDNKIALAYKCYYNKNPSKEYSKFMKLMKIFASKVENYVDISIYPNKSLLKLIDEYNYFKFTNNWI